jgi:phage gpG-like protein
MAQKFNFAKIEAKFRAAQAKIPRIVARKAVNHSLKAFDDQGFTDATFSPWKARTTSNRADRATGKRRAILVDSGNLRRSIRASSATWSRIAIGAYGINYATFHNQGTNRLPRRRFLGPSKVLNAQIRGIIRNEILKTFQ